MSEVWWVDPPKNTTGGGELVYFNHDAAVAWVHDFVMFPKVGWACQKQQSLPFGSDKYESYVYHTYFKFAVPTTSGTFDNAHLHLMVFDGRYKTGSDGGVRPAYVKMDVYGKPDIVGPPNPFEFPYESLDEGDYPDSWVKIGQFSENLADMTDNWESFDDYWVTELDVTSGFQVALDHNWEWFAIRLSPSYDAPIDWDYDDQKYDYDEYCDVAIGGALNSYYKPSPLDFPDSYATANPWLEITYSSAETQVEPGEPYVGDPTSGYIAISGYINCIAADTKAQTAIVGTSVILISGEDSQIIGGSLYYTWSGGGEWKKIYEYDEPITAVYMDYVKNFLDYPDDEIAWFGTSGGSVYKSVSSFNVWTLSKTFQGYITEIRGSEMDSNKVAVGVGNCIYTTTDGGSIWNKSLEV